TEVAGEAIARNQGLDALRGNPRLMREMLQTVVGRTGATPPEEKGFPGPPGHLPPGGPDHAGPPGRPPRNADFRGRVAIYDLQGMRVTGFPLDAEENLLSLPITVDGTIVAYAKAALPVESDGIDADFLRHQSTLIALAAIALLLCSAITSWLMAKRWAGPLRDIQTGTALVAAGDFDVRLNERGSIEIADAIGNINAMVAALKRLETARRRWLADISHELRTPVTVLRGEIECLHDGIRQPSEAVIRSLHEEIIAVSALLDDVHLISVADLGKMPCRLSQFDLVAQCRRAIERFRSIAGQRGIDLEFDSPCEQIEVTADIGRIDQVLGNLLSNALKYTDAPGRIRVSAGCYGGGAALAIEDSAPAPDHGEIERLFEPFYRTDSSRNRMEGGTGLGLAVCKAIVEAHGGQIKASASALGGLRIDIELPAGG
ncbi:MAG TPA: ATP-binding protein, partial [Dokdonella sp.]|nr:ATP-binding protein [Dokdonella sp.]